MVNVVRGVGVLVIFLIIGCVETWWKHHKVDKEKE